MAWRWQWFYKGKHHISIRRRNNTTLKWCFTIFTKQFWTKLLIVGQTLKHTNVRQRHSITLTKTSKLTELSITIIQSISNNESQNMSSCCIAIIVTYSPLLYKAHIVIQSFQYYLNLTLIHLFCRTMQNSGNSGLKRTLGDHQMRISTLLHPGWKMTGNLVE